MKHFIFKVCHILRKIQLYFLCFAMIEQVCSLLLWLKDSGGKNPLNIGLSYYKRLLCLFSLVKLTPCLSLESIVAKHCAVHCCKALCNCMSVDSLLCRREPDIWANCFQPLSSSAEHWASAPCKKIHFVWMLAQGNEWKHGHKMDVRAWERSRWSASCICLAVMADGLALMFCLSWSVVFPDFKILQ